jgi:sulfate permease, SulP family
VFIKRMADASEARRVLHASTEDTAEAQDHDLLVYRLSGPFFFGAAAQLGTVLDRIADSPQAFVIDFSDVPFIDSSGAHAFERLAHKMQRRGGQLYLVGANADSRRMLVAQGAREPLVRYLPDIDSVRAARADR